MHAIDEAHLVVLRDIFKTAFLDLKKTIVDAEVRQTPENALKDWVQNQVKLSPTFNSFLKKLEATERYYNLGADGQMAVVSVLACQLATTFNLIGQNLAMNLISELFNTLSTLQAPSRDQLASIKREMNQELSSCLDDNLLKMSAELLA